MAENCHSEGLTEEEAAVYDRQIRLWGVEAQNRLKKGRVLISGLTGLGNEICKNLILAGIQSITVIDPETLTQENIGQQFLAPQSCVGQARAKASFQNAQKMNPMVSLKIDTGKIEEKTENFFKDFDLVVLFDPIQENVVKISQICHSAGVKFMWGAVYGQYGVAISDFGKHVYFQEKTKVSKATLSGDGPSGAKRSKLSNEEETEIEEKTTEFLPISEAFTLEMCKDMAPRKLQALPKAYLIMHVMLRYNKLYGNTPKRQMSSEDWTKLHKTRDEVMNDLGVDQKYLTNEVLREAVGFLYPVSSVVGGIMSQEVIKALSGKDCPYDNAFLFDGDSYSGTVMKLCHI